VLGFQKINCFSENQGEKINCFSENQGYNFDLDPKVSLGQFE
jgi:hypothetical protein